MDSSNQNDWGKKSLGEVITLQRGHDLPEAERKSGNIPIMGSFGITGTHSTAKAKGMPWRIVCSSGEQESMEPEHGKTIRLKGQETLRRTGKSGGNLLESIS